jgi:hypothetical protein
MGAATSSEAPKEQRWIMNREVETRDVRMRTGERSARLGKVLALAVLAACPHGSALRAADYTSDAVTQVCVLVGPAPVFHPFRGWVEQPQPSAPRGYVMLPIPCYSGKRAPRLWLCYRRGLLEESPLSMIQVATHGSLDGSGLDPIAVPLKKRGEELPLHFYCKRASGEGDLVVTDILLRTTFERVRGYECDGQNLNEPGGNPVYLYYKQKEAASIQGPPFAQGIRPEMLNAPDTEYEIARAQLDNDRLLVRVQKLEVKHVTVAARMPFRRTESIKLGMSRQELNEIKRSLNVGVDGDYLGLKSCVSFTLGWTSSTTYTTNEETTLTEEVNLPAEDHDRYYAFATVLDILRIKEIATGKVLAEAVSRTDNIGYFVTDRYGSWTRAPRSGGALH